MDKLGRRDDYGLARVAEPAHQGVHPKVNELAPSHRQSFKSAGAIDHGFSIDLEDAEAACVHLATGKWHDLGRNLDEQIDLLLQLLEQYCVRATFFTVARLASQKRAIMKRIVQAGHEIGCHGLNHERTPDSTVEFRYQVRTARQILQDVTDQPIVGFRAPCFSISASALWKLRVLREEGYTYDSTFGASDWAKIRGSGQEREDICLPVEVPVFQFSRGSKVSRVGAGHLATFSPSAFKEIRGEMSRSKDPKIIYMHPYNFGLNRRRSLIPIPLHISVRHLHIHNVLSTLFRRRVETLMRLYSWKPLGELIGV